MAENQLRKYAARQRKDLRPKRPLLEGERYHLHCMHTIYFPGIIDMLRRRLHAMTGAQVTLTADCIWVDGTPKAHWSVNEPMDKYVELADLMLEVSVTSGGATTRRAVLVQAKYTDECDDLGNGSCHPGQDDSTNLERDLLEVHSGGIRLYASGKRSTPIPALYQNKFNLSKDLNGKKLISHSRYLLFPDNPNATGTPYLSLTPYNRTVGQGFHEDYEELLCRLADRSTSTVPDLQGGQQWTALVNAVGAWATAKAAAGRTLGRFGANTPYRQTQFLVLPRLTIDLMEHYHFWQGHPFFASKRAINNGGEIDEDMPKGFWYVRMSVAYR